MARAHPIRDAGLALSLLTVVPTPARFPEQGGTQAAAWFAWVGLAVGAVGYAMAKGAEFLNVADKAPMMVAASIVAVWALGTRMLHWDGLADVADGFWGSHEPARRLEIMSDSHTGAFGATAVALTALVEVAAVAAVIAAPHQSPVLVAPVFARFAATAAAWFGSPARPGGLGRSVTGRPSPLALLVSALALAIALWFLWLTLAVTGIAIGVFGIVCALAVPHLLSMRFGGVTGDVMGASVLITEVLVFVAFVVAG